MLIGGLKESDLEKLMQNRTINRNNCWLWTGPIYNGYGRIVREDGRLDYVHRVAAEHWLNLPTSGDFQIKHRCKSRCCFNPEHLKIVMRSAFKKNRDIDLSFGAIDIQDIARDVAESIIRDEARQKPKEKSFMERVYEIERGDNE